MHLPVHVVIEQVFCVLLCVEVLTGSLIVPCSCIYTGHTHDEDALMLQVTDGHFTWKQDHNVPTQDHNVPTWEHNVPIQEQEPLSQSEAEDVEAKPTGTLDLDKINLKIKPVRTVINLLVFLFFLKKVPELNCENLHWLVLMKIFCRVHW